MKIRPAKLSGMLLIEPVVHQDDRGFFLETFHKDRYQSAGLVSDFVQDNHSFSQRGTLRGLHYQLPCPQGKLVWVIRGEVMDVAVDLRRGSPTFSQWQSVILSGSNRQQIYVPPGMAHGFCVISDVAEVIYKCTEYYRPQHQHTLRWNDPDLGIKWPASDPLLSEQDRRGCLLSEAAVYE